MIRQCTLLEAQAGTAAWKLLGYESLEPLGRCRGVEESVTDEREKVCELAIVDGDRLPQRCVEARQDWIDRTDWPPQIRR